MIRYKRSLQKRCEPVSVTVDETEAKSGLWHLPRIIPRHSAPTGPNFCNLRTRQNRHTAFSPFRCAPSFSTLLLKCLIHNWDAIFQTIQVGPKTGPSPFPFRPKFLTESSHFGPTTSDPIPPKHRRGRRLADLGCAVGPHWRRTWICGAFAVLVAPFG